VDICLVYFYLNVSLQITSRSFINIAADIITLDVSDNNVHLIEREAFSGINRTLEVLLLHHNHLIQILPHFFSNLRKVCEYGIQMLIIDALTVFKVFHLLLLRVDNNYSVL